MAFHADRAAVAEQPSIIEHLDDGPLEALLADESVTEVNPETGEELLSIRFANSDDNVLLSRSYTLRHDQLALARALKFLRPRFGKQKLSDITPKDIESYLMTRLNTGRMASSTVFSQLFPLVALTQLRGVCFRSQRLRPARLMGEFFDGFLTVVAATAIALPHSHPMPPRNLCYRDGLHNR